MTSTDQRTAVERSIVNAMEVIRGYRWMLDLYVVDFFVDEHWEKLPPSWRRCLETAEGEQLSSLVSGCGSVLAPLSLLALLQLARSAALPREPRPTPRSACPTRHLHNLFTKHVKLKKRHEISVMSELVYKMSVETGCNTVLDFGSGVGHLVRLLGYGYGLSTVGIESQQQLTEDARKLDLELEYSLRKHMTEQEFSKLCRPTHMNVTLGTEELELPGVGDSYGLVGLHPCGDLGPLLLRHFADNSRVKFVCVVGCCYMKLRCGAGQGEDLRGYPMSELVSNLREHQLSYVSREIACHALDVYLERLERGEGRDLKVHAYRAALELVLQAERPPRVHAPVRSVKIHGDMSFQSYCERAVSRLQCGTVGVSDRAQQAVLQWRRVVALYTIRLAVAPVVETVLLLDRLLYLMSRGTFLCGTVGVSDRAQQAVRQWRRVVALYTIRLAVAPVVETVLLLDRLLYLLSRGLSCEIWPVFDPRISPRNHVIVARR